MLHVAPCRPPIVRIGLALLTIALTACTPLAGAPAAPAKSTAPQVAAPAGPLPAAAIQPNPVAPKPAAAPANRLTTAPAKAAVGDEVRISGDGLAPGASLDLAWDSISGSWAIEDYYFFRGRQFTKTRQMLTQVRVDDQGRLDTSIRLPEDYGGPHYLFAMQNGEAVAMGAVELTQSFEMTPSEGPVGTLVEIRAKGLGWQTMENTWVVNWDNRAVGWVSAVETRGSATARFRATGPIGDHEIKVYTGYMGQSYLNHEQAPTAYLPRPHFTFRTTPGSAAEPAYIEPYVRQPVPEPASSGASLQLTPTQGPVHTSTTLSGQGLPARASLSLVWTTMVGSRVADTGFEPRETVLATVTTGADGRFTAPVTIPDDLGGLHTLLLRQGDQELARTYFVVETSIVSISPTSGPVGTPVTIHLKGVGWTEYDNIFVVNYDNAYMGYVCGFNSNGDVVMNFTAAGAPGVHLIDFYPSIYQGPKEGQQLYRLPQLTYADDHPGNKIPALRFAFTITE